MNIKEIIGELEWLRNTYDAEFQAQDNLWDESDCEDEYAGEASWCAEHTMGKLEDVIQLLKELT